MSANATVANPYSAGSLGSTMWKLGYTNGAALVVGEDEARAEARAEAKKVRALIRSHALVVQARIAWAEGTKAGAEAMGAEVDGDPDAAGLNPRVASLRLRIRKITPAGEWYMTEEAANLGVAAIGSRY